ncbi:hypothetical protein GGS24DRAFT_493682 [Hypoxylon argillaceum]|nr:hypothetical protein GGS24DRAFT_493682 [Hypoxylon argillaceum]KAI1146048.1 hypothetical protein F4825DRAFT_466848 [Nemania diffusa]
MHTAKPFFLMTALAGASLAQMVPHSVCVSSRLSIITAGPTLPPALSPYASYLVGPATPTDPTATVTPLPDALGDPDYYISLLCSVAAQLPSSARYDFSTWGAGLLSFGSAHISEFDAYVTDCVTTGEAAIPIISSLNNLLTGTGNLCQYTAAPSGVSNGTMSTTATQTATGPNSTSSTSATSVVTAAAARPTGVFVSAVAIGSFIGAVCML